MISVDPLGRLVPGPASAEVECLPSNNNLDLCRFGGRIYLAWRTAPNHFASSRARLEVVSTDCSASRPIAWEWRHETTVSIGSDVREPRLVADGERGRLHLFFVELGSNPARFEPRRVHRVTLADGSWEPPAVAVDQPIVAWRVRRLDDRWVMSGYSGAERMYGPRPVDPQVELRFSDDLISWSEPRTIHRGGIECELVRLTDGRLLALTRNEGPSRFGSDVLLGAGVDSLGRTPCPRKLDSPNLFLWGGEPWVIARRSLAFGGRYGVAPRLTPGAVAIRVNQLAWWMTRKRSALYRVDPDAEAGPAIEWMADLPSRGDTSFAGVLEEDDGSLLVADYTSPAEAGDPRWFRGQLRRTVIELFRVAR